MTPRRTTRLLLWLGLICTPLAQAVEIHRWDRLPLAVPLVVGQERVIFIDRNVRVGVPISVADKLRVQSAGGAVYLRASDAIAPVRLQLQDADSGALILLDVSAQPAREGEPPLEPVRIVEGEGTPARYGGAAGSLADADPDQSVRRETPIPVVLTRYAAQNLYAPPAHGRASARHCSGQPATRPPTADTTANAPGRGVCAGRMAPGRSVGHCGEALQPQWPLAGPGPPRPPGRPAGGDLPALSPGPPRHAGRHHGRVLDHPWPQPGPIPATGHSSLRPYAARNRRQRGQGRRSCAVTDCSNG